MAKLKRPRRYLVGWPDRRSKVVWGGTSCWCLTLREAAKEQHQLNEDAISKAVIFELVPVNPRGGLVGAPRKE